MRVERSALVGGAWGGGRRSEAASFGGVHAWGRAQWCFAVVRTGVKVTEGGRVAVRELTFISLSSCCLQVYHISSGRLLANLLDLHSRPLCSSDH